jgi:hypothetical protein
VQHQLSLARLAQLVRPVQQALRVRQDQPAHKVRRVLQLISKVKSQLSVIFPAVRLLTTRTSWLQMVIYMYGTVLRGLTSGRS